MSSNNQPMQESATVGDMEATGSGNPRRKYPRARGLKNEWAAVVTHLEEVAGTIDQAERDMRRIKKEDLQRSYEAQMRDLSERHRQQRDREEQERQHMKDQWRKQDEIDLARRRENREGMLREELKANYESMIQSQKRQNQDKRNEEKLEALRLIDKARRSLEVESEVQKEKDRKFKDAVKDVLGRRDDVKRGEIDRVRAERDFYNHEISRVNEKMKRQEDGYRQYYKTLAERQDRLMRKFEETIASPLVNRLKAEDQYLDQIGAERFRQALEHEKQRQDRHQKDVLKNARLLKDQIMNNHQHRQDEKSSVFREEAEEQSRRRMAHEQYLASLKTDKQLQQSWYKELLDKQDYERNGVIINGHTMTKKEKAINVDPLQAYKQHENHVTVLIPGISNSKYVHPHSPEARYANVIGTSTIQSKASKRDSHAYAFTQGGMDSSRMKDASPKSMFEHSASQGVLSNGGSFVEAATPKRGSHYKLSPSVFADQQVRHNPITNPVPNHFVNPYIHREYLRLNQGQASPRYLASLANTQLLGGDHKGTQIDPVIA